MQGLRYRRFISNKSENIYLLLFVYFLSLRDFVVTLASNIKQRQNRKIKRLNYQLVTFRVSRIRSEMYCGHPRLCVCMSVRGRMPTLSRGPGCNLGEW